MKKRVVTNSDLDAITSAVLLKRVEDIGSIKFINHNEINTEGYQAKTSDIVVNLPCLKNCNMWFDHHDSNKCKSPPEGRYDANAPSAARVVYDYYTQNGKEGAFNGLEQLLQDTDKVDDARLNRDDILNPKGAVLLEFLIDKRPKKVGSVADNMLAINMLDEKPPSAVINHPVFSEKAKKYREKHNQNIEMLEENLETDGGVLILDQRKINKEVDLINKYLPYAIYDDCHTFLKINPVDDNTTRISLGFNVLMDNKHCPLNYGHMLSNYNGGGHRRAGGCSVHPNDVDEAFDEMVQSLKEGRILAHERNNHKRRKKSTN